MNAQIVKAKFAGSVFVLGVKQQAKDVNTLEMATIVGIAQGLKYRGNIRLGLETAAVVFGVVCISNGAKCIIQNWDVIKSY